MNKLKEINVIATDKYGGKSIEPISFRISIYFDYDQDNHHIEIMQGASKYNTITALRNLIRLIEKSEEAPMNPNNRRER
jgi:hypothetical protein